MVKLVLIAFGEAKRKFMFLAISRGAADVKPEYELALQIVFDGAVPDATLKSSGVVSLRREGRVLSVLCRGAEADVVAEARALNPKAIDVLPVTLKEIFLETVGAEN